MSHRILILGAGNVGIALGSQWLLRGHDVHYGVTHPSDPKHASLPKDRVQPAHERREAQIVVLAVPYGAAESAVKALGDLTGVVVIDCTNPLTMGPDGLQLSMGFTTSAGEQIAALAPKASVFKTFNQTGAENMSHAADYPSRPVMFVAGDDAGKKPLVLGLVSDLGFEAIDAGPMSVSRLLEPFGMLWIELALKRGVSRDFAFALVRRPAGS